MKKYEVTGMSCASCSARVEKAVSRVEGVKSCSVSLLTNTMSVEGQPEEAQIIKAVEEMAEYPHYYEEGQILKNVLDLIARKQAEIERLKNENMAKEAEYNDMLEQRNSVEEHIETAKSEAVKEFAERLKEIFEFTDDTYECWEIEGYIDNIVKEMVEEKK